MIVCGLDIATSTGVAVGPIGGRPELWTADLGAGQPHDARFMAMQSLVHNLIAEHGVTHIGLEAPVQAMKNTAKVNGLLMGLSAVVRGWAYRKGVPVELFPVPTIKKHFIGVARLPRAEAKRAVIAACERRGWTPEDDNQADAAAVWSLMCARLSPGYAAASAPIVNRH